MARTLALLGVTFVAGCSVVDTGASREAEYYARIQSLERRVEELRTSLESAEARVRDLAGEEHARFIDAYLRAERATPEAAIAAWESFLVDFPESPLGGAAREWRDRSRARLIERNVVEAEEYRVLLDKLETVEAPQRKVLIEDFLARFPGSPRKADLDKRLDTLREIEALKRELLGEAARVAPPDRPAPPAIPAADAPEREYLNVPRSGR